MLRYLIMGVDWVGGWVGDAAGVDCLLTGVLAALTRSTTAQCARFVPRVTPGQLSSTIPVQLSPENNPLQHQPPRHQNPQHPQIFSHHPPFGHPTSKRCQTTAKKCQTTPKRCRTADNRDSIESLIAALPRLFARLMT